MVNNSGLGRRNVILDALFNASRYHRPTDWDGSINTSIGSNVINSGRTENLSGFDTGTTP